MWGEEGQESGKVENSVQCEGGKREAGTKGKWSIRERVHTLVLRRYDINSNSPSGGINEIVRSFSKRVKRTHWWNLTSSNSIPFPPLGAPANINKINTRQVIKREENKEVKLLLDASNWTLSLSPRRNSGIPLKNDFILTAPTISERKTVPFPETCPIIKYLNAKTDQYKEAERVGL